MKKIVALCLMTVIIFAMIGCSGMDRYRVTVKDKENYLIVNELKSQYQAGEEVTIQLETVTEQYYVLFVNGEKHQQTQSDLYYTYFTFVMPSEDVMVEIDIVSVDIPSAPENQ